MHWAAKVVKSWPLTTTAFIASTVTLLVINTLAVSGGLYFILRTSQLAPPATSTIAVSRSISNLRAKVNDSIDWQSHRQSANASVVKPLVLGWTPYFGRRTLVSEALLGGDPATNGSGVSMEGCKWKCEYTDQVDRYTPDRPTVFVHHSPDIDPHHLPQIHGGYYFHVYYSLESPINSRPYLSRQLPPSYFNATMTYRQDSTLHWPYDRFERWSTTRNDSAVNRKERWEWAEVRAKVQKKNKLAVIFVSHCTTDSRREAYVRELEKYMPVTRVGTCSSNYCQGKECMERELGEDI